MKETFSLYTVKDIPLITRGYLSECFDRMIIDAKSEVISCSGDGDYDYCICMDGGADANYPMMYFRKN